MTTTLKAVIFDLDGTLVDSLPLICESFRYVLQEYLPEQNHDYDRILGFVGRPLEDLMAEISPDPEMAALLVTKYREHNRAILKMVKVFPGIPQCLDQLQQLGLRLAIVTSKNNLSTDMTMAAVNLGDDTFEHIIAKEDTTQHKPHPEPLLTVCDKMAVHPNTVAYVGDSVFDIECAHNAGAKALAALWGAHDPERVLAAQPHQSAAAVTNLVDAIKTLNF